MRLLLFTSMLLLTLSTSAQHFFLFAGTYTSGKSKGIYVYDFNAKNGEVGLISFTDSAANPSYIAISANGKYVYAVNEISRSQAGLVAAYAFDAQTGTLKLINQQSSGSENPCHLSLTKDGKWLTVANYTGGSLAVFPLNDDGSIQPFAQHIVHTGKGANPQRQEKPHVHSTFFSPDEKLLLTPDLGTDKVNMYQFSSNQLKPLKPAATKFLSANPGSGPRHLEFAPSGSFFYVVEEITGTVTAYQYNSGKPKAIQTIATHAADFKGQPGSADIHVSPDGKFLYASNRGEENNLAIFSIDQNTGLLTSVGYQSTMGNHPRNFMIDPTGNFLLVANMRSNNMVVFKRDKLTGLLQKTMQQIEIPNPSCLKMLAR